MDQEMRARMGFPRWATQGRDLRPRDVALRPMMHYGDPGLFSFLGKVGKGIVGAVGGGVKGLLKGGVSGAVTGAIRGGAAGVGLGRTGIKQARLAAPLAPSGGGFMPGTGIQFRTGGGGGVNLGYFPETGGGTMIGPDGMPRRKGRRMNPLNPRALSRAMRRIVSAKKAANFLDKIHIGAKPRRRTFAAPRCAKKCR